MADTVAKLVLQAIAARLSVISTLNGYNTNAGQEVYRGRTQFNPTENMPALSVFAGEETYGDTAHQDRMSIALQIDVVCHANVCMENPQDEIQDLIGDVKQALYHSDDRYLNGLLSDLKPVDVRTQSPEDAASTVAAIVTASAEYPEMYGDPYTVI